MNDRFLARILRRWTASSPELAACLTDAAGRVVAAVGLDDWNAFSEAARRIAGQGRPSLLDDGGAGGGSCVYGMPISFGSAPWGAVLVSGRCEQVRSAAEGIAGAVEAVLDFEANGGEESDPNGRLVHSLLADPLDAYEIQSRMNELELDPALLRAVICISLDYRQNRYFNINLNLGYQSSGERIKNEVACRVRSGKYFNSQDLCVGYDANTVLVVKSFQPLSDRTKAHLALDRICLDIAAALSDMPAVSFSMACGNAYEGIARVRESYAEAREIIDIGRRTHPGGAGQEVGSGYFRLSDIMFDSVCRFLNPLTRTNVIDPYLDLLYRREGRIQKEIIECGELFVDCCMNLAAAAKTGYLHRNTIAGRLRKLEELTGLVPASNFRDAFIVKMLAVHIRQHDL